MNAMRLLVLMEKLLDESIGIGVAGLVKIAGILLLKKLVQATDDWIVLARLLRLEVVQDERHHHV
jgi:hypothetical protein